MDYRSPLENFFGIIGGLPQGHDKPVKHALYNAVAHFLLILCLAVAWALYIILEQFIKPLIWALLVGSVLHPLKRSLRDRFQLWFEKLEINHTPVVLGIGLLPINIINDLSDFIGDQLKIHFKIIVGVCVSVVGVLVAYNYTPMLITTIFWNTSCFLSSFLSFFLEYTSSVVMVVILVGYFSLILFVWKPENNKKFHYASIIIWLLLSCYFAHQFGRFEFPVFILMQLIIFGGFACEVYEIYNEINSQGLTQSFSLIETLSLVFDNKIDQVLEATDESTETEDDKTNGDSSESTENKNKEEVVQVVKKSDKEKPVSSVKFKNDQNIGDTKPSKPKEDPWALDLFEDKKPIDVIKRTDSELSNTSLLITNQGIHVIKQPPGLSDILQTTATKKKLKRSASQPHFYTNSKTKLFFKRKLSLKDSNQSLIDTETYESTFYLCAVLWACVIMIFWKNLVLVPLLLIPILFYIVKHLGRYFGLWNLLYDHCLVALEIISKWCNERHDALVPIPIRGLFRIIDKVNVYLKSSIKSSIDTVSSCVVIFGLIIFLTCASIFIAFQIYAETIMMVQMTSNVINQTVVHNPELRQLLPPAFDDTVDSVLNNAYQYGREGISKTVKSILTDVDSAKSEKLERQVLELWDRLYQTWMSSDNSPNGPKVTQEAVQTSWEEFLTDVQKSPEMFNLNGIIDFAKQNIGTLMSLLESVWVIVKGNIGLVLGSFSAVLSILLGGGTAVLNFFFNVIVFLTTLFYLLSSSGDNYKPVEIMTNFSSSSKRFGHALEGAVNGVFTASFKMAAFYGMWTWFIHNLFDAKIVYLPSAFATILGAVPFLGTYWACFPAVLDLWLAQDRGIAAILFAICQFLPTSIVDTTIYKEIKGGGHPYLTGLAIAGGIFCLGVEGAIIGPLLLCGLYVAIDLSSTIFKESPSEESLNLRLQLQDR